MKIDSYTLLGLVFLALAILLKFAVALDTYLLKLFNSLMFSEIFFSYFTEIGNGFICLAIIVPIFSYASIEKCNANSRRDADRQQRFFVCLRGSSSFK